MRRSSERTLAFLLAASLAIATAPIVARADGSPSKEALTAAHEKYNQGLDLEEAGDVTGALAKYEEAHALAATPVVDDKLARTYEKRGRWIDALRVAEGVAAIPTLKGETDTSAKARADAAALAKTLAAKIPTVRVVVTSNAPVTLTIDGAPASVDAPARIDPGDHAIEAKSGAASRGKTITAKEGDALVVSLVFDEAPAKPLVVTPVEKAPDRTLAIVGFSVGGAGLVVGAITGFVALHDASTVKGQCDGGVCPTSAHSTYETSRTMGTISTIGFVFAGVGAAVGVYGLLSSGSSSSEPRVEAVVGPGAIGVRGAF